MTRQDILRGLFFLVLIFGLTGNAYCLGWFNIANAKIENLGGDSYRLAVDVDWGGGEYHHMSYPDITTMPTLRSVEFAPLLGVNHSNPTFNGNPINDPLNWGDRAFWIEPDKFMGLTGNRFGYDFEYADPLPLMFEMTYQAHIDWDISWDEAPEPDSYFEEFSGSFAATAIPEPTTIILFAIGTIGFGVRRFRLK